MGLFTQAQWICDAPFSELPPRNVFRRQQSKDPLPPHRDELCNHHWLVRGSFELQTVPNDARLLITADDHYRLWINGQFVGIGPAPGFPHHYYCNTWDVSRFLRKGRNVIAVHVYYQGLLNRVWVSADHRQGMIAELKQDDRVLFSSSSTWRGIRSAAWASAGTVGYATHFLERFDCRSYDAHWRNIDFDDSAWPAVHVKQQHDYTFVAQPTPTLKMYEVKPVAIHPLNDGASCWLDFGRELTGTLLARARGPAGAEIELRYGEELLADGRVRHAMRCNCDYREYWILSGRDDELEQVDYKGCRYAEVIVPPGAQVDADSIRIQVRHYPLNEDRFAWSSSENDLNAIVELCVHSLRIGAQDALLDCPTREKGAYLGDATISGHAHMLVSADLAYARKSLDDYAQTAFICPGLMSVAPCSFMQEIADYSLQSPAQLLRFFMHSGDMECLSAHVTTLENLMRYFQRFARADGLLADVTEKWNLVDWPANLRDGYDFPLTDPPQKGIHAVLNAFWLAAIRDTNAILALLGKPPFADEASCREAFQRTFYSPELRLFVDAPGSQHASLHSNALALYADAAPAEALPRIIDLIREKRFACGVYMAYFVLKGLARGGAHDLVYDLILDDGEHSWRNMLREGATTLFEAWGKDQKWNTSLCHPWASAPIPVLIEDILGVTPAEPGWRAIRFAPRIPQRLKEVSLKFTTVCGEILVTHDSRGTNIRAPGGVRVLRE